MRTSESTYRGDDGKKRCFWCQGDAEYERYHDEEWGLPVRDDKHLFEKLCLEGFQAGLSWLTILRKRDEFRRVFYDFDMARVARMRERDILRLLQNPGIIRHRGKIEATIGNASRALELRAEFGSLDAFFWQYVPPQLERPRRITREELPNLAQTETSRALSRELKRRGFRFVGPTTCYAFMQAMGMVNDHMHGCAFRTKRAAEGT